MIFQFDGKYGVASTFYFSLCVEAAENSNRFVATAAASLFAAGDVQISKDGGNFANIGTLPTQVQTTSLYILTVSAAEMQATQSVVIIKDADGPEFRDAYILIRTKQLLGQIDVNATEIGSNTPALSLVGVGTSPGLLATGGSTSAGDITGYLTNMTLRKNTAQSGGASSIRLDTGASSTNDYYNGCVVMLTGGTGAGQFRVITDYVGSNTTATVNRSWVTNPASGTIFMIMPSDEVWDIPSTGELSALPTSTSTYAKFIQFLFQIFAYKKTQSATTFTTFKADSSTTIGTQTLSDDGTTQTVTIMS